jgi:hypothetical protein
LRIIGLAFISFKSSTQFLNNSLAHTIGILLNCSYSINVTSSHIQWPLNRTKDHSSSAVLNRRKEQSWYMCHSVVTVENLLKTNLYKREKWRLL